MAKTFIERLDPNSDAQMDAFNTNLCAFVEKYGYSIANPPEFVPRGQAAEFISCCKQDIGAMVYRGTMTGGPERGTVLLDDVIAKVVIAPFVERS